ncbi:APC family permease [Companilactobacillus sp. RD055328]|uniref:APC family permease n=1 Tax=Companilactobacillus sp. RD055328 TaxID=2916634 RepID=UPI0035CEA831
MRQLFAKKDLTNKFDESSIQLEKTLSAKDLIFMGLGVIIGAGIFITPGIIAANNAGPGVMFTYILAAIVCILVAFCYSEFSSAIPLSGSAYTYVYSVFGELTAWIVGWAIFSEYLFAESSVAVSWSAYLQNFLSGFGIKLPAALQSAYGAGGTTTGRFDILAFTIVFLVTILLLQGLKESVTINKIMVYIKVFIIILFIVVAIFYVKPSNFTPLLPFGASGLGQGTSVAFFAFIGFDIISTASEEVKNPGRDMPIGIISSLLISALLYSLMAFVLVGAVHYTQLNVADPVSLALRIIHQNWAAGLISLCAVLGMTTTLIVILYGGTRMFFAISRDGLLPNKLNNLNKNNVPTYSTIIFGLLAGLVAGLLPIDKLTELVNIGALLGFAAVSIGVIPLRRSENTKYLNPAFKTPGYPIVPIISFLLCIYLMLNLQTFTWIAFGLWLLLGLIIYICYGYKNSKLHK